MPPTPGQHGLKTTSPCPYPLAEQPRAQIGNNAATGAETERGRHLRPSLVRSQFADDLHDEARTEDETLAEAAIGHHADQLVVDIDELQ